MSKCRHFPCLSLWLSSEIWAAATPVGEPWDFLQGYAAQGLLRESSVDVPFRALCTCVTSAICTLSPASAAAVCPSSFPHPEVFSTSWAKWIPWKTLTVWSEIPSSLHCFLFWSWTGSARWGRKTPMEKWLYVSAVGTRTHMHCILLPVAETFSFAWAFGNFQIFLLWMQTLFPRASGTCWDAALSSNLLRYPYARHRRRRKLWRGRRENRFSPNWPEMWCLQRQQLGTANCSPDFFKQCSILT